MKKPLIAVLLTCFNRRETSLAAIAALWPAVGTAARYRVVAVDDGSSDGTGSAIRARDPDALVVDGPGNLYWNGGTRLAWQTALPLKPDYFLWLNDDTCLRPGAIANMLELFASEAEPRTIVVGRTVDPQDGETSYGGYRRVERSRSRLRFRRLGPEENECDTMNGNCVLFPALAAVEIGINSPVYRHAFGDNDYGLRARKAGWRIVEMKQPVATQERNHKFDESQRTLSWRNWRFVLFHPKGVPLSEWAAFCWAHGGWLAPVNFLYRYWGMWRRGREIAAFDSAIRPLGG